MKSGLSLWLWEDEVTLNEGDFRRHGGRVPWLQADGVSKLTHSED